MSNASPELIQIQQSIWTELAYAISSIHHPYRVAALATMAEGPDVRSVVLQQIDPTSRQLVIYSDQRARKVAQIRSDPRVALYFYDPTRMVQLRVYGTAAVVDDPAVNDEHWNRVEPNSLMDYASASPPGTVIESPEQGDAMGELAAMNAAARPNFAVIRAIVSRIDYLLLSAAGRRRARFVYGDVGGVAYDWLQP